MKDKLNDQILKLIKLKSEASTQIIRMELLLMKEDFDEMDEQVRLVVSLVGRLCTLTNAFAIDYNKLRRSHDTAGSNNQPGQ